MLLDYVAPSYTVILNYNTKKHVKLFFSFFSRLHTNGKRDRFTIDGLATIRTKILR